MSGSIGGYDGPQEITDSRLINLRDSIPGGEWTGGRGPRGYQFVSVEFANHWGMSFQVETLTGAGGSYCGPGTVEARIFPWSEDTVSGLLADVLNPIDPGHLEALTYGYANADTCTDLAKRLRRLPDREGN